MAPKRRQFLGVVAGSLVLAGCLGDDESGADSDDGGDDSTDGDDGTDGDDSTDGDDGTDGDDSMDDGGDDTTDGGVTVQVVDTDDQGRILAGPDGMTVYAFDSDEQGAGESTCYDACAEAWPPLTVEGEPAAGTDVDAELTMFEREDGSMQVAANGWPLYYFQNDASGGDTNGQGVNDVWWVLDPSGAPMRDTGGDDDGGPDY